ncbi:MAG: helix-turn-helix transcriptional regulator [Chloroflexota bacterium]|nr:helix-turn-helix transcriptional regulator [Chloroflexota bacterium]
MVPVTPGAFVFDPGALVKVRSALGLSQAQMAARLGVPQNTVSRWETGTTTPDAHSLAAFYSVAQEEELVVNLFVKNKKQKKTPLPTRVVCYLDLATLGLQAYEAELVHSYVRKVIEQHVPTATGLVLKVFPALGRPYVTSAFVDLGWREQRSREEMLNQARSDIGQPTHTTIAVLITADDGVVGLIEDLRDNGKKVYALTPLYGPLGNQIARLSHAVGEKRHLVLPVGNGAVGFPLSPPL